ncbi:MAG: hypothetical protein CEN87_172 [Parcubacteria group bacterium Licking1014_1]|nr:MAG: hypothetical protein CEN87_172 [Parcubacteria group bacterium Licking1014_1]
MTSSKILFYFCILFVVGIFSESVIKIPQIFLWVFLFLGVLLIFMPLLFKHIHINRLPQSKRSLGLRITLDLMDLLVAVGFCILFLIIGILRMQISEFNIANDELSKLNGSEAISLIGAISAEPDVRDTYQKLKINISQSTINNQQSAILGTISISANRYPEYRYLDKLKITGFLEAPPEFEDFNYKNYLLKDGIYSVMNFPKVELLEKENYRRLTSVIYSEILRFKQKLRESIRRNFSPPQSLILEGTVLGDNGALTQDLKDKLNITGLRHIIAVSGTHVVILGSIIMSLLLAFGFWRGQAFYIAIIFICFYIILTGLPASGVRAGIMGGLYLLAQKLGRQSMGSRVIASACAIMLLINPLLLLYDVGFQLSFLAVMGLIYLEPLIKSFIKIFTKKKAESFVNIVSTTFAAQIFTLPIMVYNFGNISFVSPITNLLILPIVYWLMIFGFLSAFFGVIFNYFAWLISMPCWFLLTYFVKVMDFFSQSWAAKTIENVSWVWLAVSYLVIGFLVRFLNKLNRIKFLGY